MFGAHFQLNEQTMSIVEEIGRYMPGGFFIYKVAQPEELLYANRAVCNIFGCKDLEEFKELTGFTFKGMLHPEDYQKIVKSISEQIETNEERMDHVEYRIVRKDGSIRWVDDYGHYIESEAYGGIYYVFISDITEKHEQEASDTAVRQAVIEALSEIYETVWLISDLESETFVHYRGDRDPNAPIRDESGKLKYSLAKEYYIRTTVVPGDRERLTEDLELHKIASGLQEHSRYYVNHLRMMSDGSERYFRIEFAKVAMPDGKMGIVCGFRDVDEEIRADMRHSETLKDALAAAEQANRAKTAFLSSMSHEIRTPMNAIIGLDNIALSDAELSPRTRDYLEKIGTSAHHLLSIINAILDMSRIESGRMVINNEEFSFSKIMDQVNTIIGGQCQNKGLIFESRMIGEIGDYYIGDDMKLKQVLINILGNAVKFTPRDGRVKLIVEPLARFDGNSTIRFTISDTGIGMSREYLPRIFDPFTQEDSSSTNQYGSTGLGMPITKRLVELMNGTIEVESEKGIGTTFTVTVTLKESSRKVLEEEEMEISPQDMHVLVIDDDPVACEHAKLVLGQEGINCDVAYSGAQGVEMVKLRHARREPYNLILVDWKMPEPDGIETTRMIREVVGAESAIIILTSFNWDDVAEEAKKAGVDTFVPKPIMVSGVMEEFKEAFKKKRCSVKPEISLEGRRVLLAEDVVINAEIMVMVLSMRDIEVEHVENGLFAVESFESHEAGYYDAILMDMRMPVMDGLEAARRIRALDRPDAKEIPIIALTANAFDEDVQRSMQAGLNAHLSKPVEPEALYGTLESLMK